MARTMKTMLKRLVLYYPDDSIDELQEKLAIFGHGNTSRFTVAAVRRWFKDDLKFLRSEGFDIPVKMTPPFAIAFRLQRHYERQAELVREASERTTEFRHWYQ